MNRKTSEVSTIEATDLEAIFIKKISKKFLARGLNEFCFFVGPAVDRKLLKVLLDFDGFSVRESQKDGRWFIAAK